MYPLTKLYTFVYRISLKFDKSSYCLLIRDGTGQSLASKAAAAFDKDAYKETKYVDQALRKN